MPRNSSGVYSLPAGNPVIPDTLIESTWANPTMSDIGQALTDSLPRNGAAPMTGPLTLSADPITQARQAVSKVYVDSFLAYATGMPIAAISPYAGPTAPPGWLLCDGQAVSRTTYPDLFAAIGVIYGAGDNATTFNVPDLRNEFIRGLGGSRTLGSKQIGSFAAHTHGITDPGHSHNHSHTFGTGGQSNSHSHQLNDPGHAHGISSHPWGAGFGGAGGNSVGGDNRAAVAWGSDPNGTGISMNNTTTDHTHSGTTNASAVASGTGISTVGAGGAETVPQNMALNYYIKALKDGTSTITPVLAVESEDTQMISINETNPSIPIITPHANVPFGIPKLDANAKVPLAQIPNLTSNNLGFFDASPGLLPVGTFASGDTYTISVGGTLTVYNPVTLVSAPTVVSVGAYITYITGSPTNPTGWYAQPMSTSVAASAVAFTPSGTIAAGNVQAAIAELDSETQAALSGKATATPSAFSAFVLGVAVSGFANASPLAPTQINVNEGGEYNSATGRFTCAVAGLYQFNLNIGVVGAAAPTFTGLYSVLLRNGMYWVYGSGFGNVSVPEATSAGSTLIYLQPGDYVQCAVTGQFGAGCTLNVDEFSGFFVRRMP